MAEVTLKSTKAEIMEAYKAAKAKLDAQAQLIDDPVKAAMAEKKTATLASADDIATQDILNPNIVAKYNDLKEAIDIKKAELKDLYDLDSEANSFVAMVNAHKEKEIELKEKYDAKNKELDDSHNAKTAELNDDIYKLQQKKNEILDSIETEAADLKASIEKQRKRDKEEYDYNIKRERKAADDEWDDKVAKREKELNERIAAVRADEAEIAEKTAYIEDLEKKVKDIPQMLQEATEEGIKKGKADADRSNAFEVRYLKQENEYKVKDLTNQISKLLEDISSLTSEKTELRKKLDDAYAQMRELAADTVRSTGGVKILNGQTQQAGK